MNPWKIISLLGRSEVNFLGQRVERPPSTFPTIATVPIFQVVGGRVAVTVLYGMVVTADFGAGLNNIQLVYTPDVGAPFNVDDGTADLDSAPVGTQLYAPFDPSDPIFMGYVIPGITAFPILPPGVITFSTSAATGGAGQLKWGAFYVPFDSGATLIPR